MKTLTVLTILIALPNVFYGMYGMNVSLPFADQPWAYAVVVLFTFVLIIAVYLLARRFRIF
jgi:Mg2+ and Co2+ transporter CorA